MYLKHFSLKERPFSISPDPRFLFMSNRYREALTHLTYGVQEGGSFVLLTGEVGTGKTTVCRCLLQQLPEETRLAFVLNPKLNSLELLATICDELKIEYPKNSNSLKLLTDSISDYLLRSYGYGHNVVVMIDEAQNLETEVMEQLRLLTNLETNQKKLLQVILVGQPELQEKLARRELRQLAQRVTARYHLRPLSLKETIAYIIHRVRIAGCNSSLFSRLSVEYLHNRTQGVPRLVNTICDRALLAAANRGKERVEKSVMIEAVEEIMGQPGGVSAERESVNFKSWLKPLALIIAIPLMAGFFYWLGQSNSDDKPMDDKPLDRHQPEISQSTQRDATDAIRNTRTVIQETRLSREMNPLQQNNKPREYIAKNVSSIKNESDKTLVERLLADDLWDNNGQMSMKQLLALWLIEYSPEKDGQGCQFALSYGLNCTRYKGEWQQLKDLNRPANLKFFSGLQGEFWGTLKHLSDVDALLVFNGKELRTKLAELSTLWTGDFVILWQAPEGFHEMIKFGDSGAAVSWLSKHLNQITEMGSQVKQTFDWGLRRQLMAYQTSRNIEADGIAGVQTILKINSESLDGIPLLDSFN